MSAVTWLCTREYRQEQKRPGTQPTDLPVRSSCRELLFPVSFEHHRSLWKHVFNLKKRWKTSTAAIIKRAYDLRLVNAVEYRQSFRYMSARGWRKGGEPNEPDLKGPELLSTALSALRTKVELTVDQLCRDLYFTPETFLTVTGVSVPLSKGRPVEVIPFRATGAG
jgi:hypothetical protein